MPCPRPGDSGRFSIDRGGHVVRCARSKCDAHSEQCCSAQGLEDVAYAVQKAGSAGISVELLLLRTGLPKMQARVAIAFLKDRGLLRTEHRLHFPTVSGIGFEAEIECLALREGLPNIAQSDLPTACGDGRAKPDYRRDEPEWKEG